MSGRTFVLASNNPKKLAELRTILAGMGLEVLSQREAGLELEAEETGSTFEENAYLKANAATEALGLPAIADDSGLCVDALGGEPGVLSARYTGRHDDTDEVRCRFLLEKMRDVEHRTARFVSCICCTFPDGSVLRARGECEGEILREMRGMRGFGYDPVFLPAGESRSMAELPAQEKNRISHRGRALRQFREELRSYYAQQ
jgi:XTP/dITP diphosphohydrolase